MTPLQLTVRFSLSAHPDIELTIPSPETTPAAKLKMLIRQQWPPAMARRRLRFIHRGKVLDDGLSLQVLVPPPLPPKKEEEDGNSSGEDDETTRLRKAKGKARDITPLPRVILNCSVGTVDALITRVELAKEERAANTPPTLANIDRPVVGRSPPPRGFDRLTAAGLDRSEISSIRMHFATLVASRFTPDERPSPNSMLRMEDEWIDGTYSETNQLAAVVNATNNNTNALDDEDGGGMGGGQFSSLDGLVGGMAMGFFFPLGALVWVLREPGMMAYQRSLYVAMGVILAAAMGLVRGFAGEA